MENKEKLMQELEKTAELVAKNSKRVAELEIKIQGIKSLECAYQDGLHLDFTFNSSEGGVHISTADITTEENMHYLFFGIIAVLQRQLEEETGKLELHQRALKVLKQKASEI